MNADNLYSAVNYSNAEPSDSRSSEPSQGVSANFNQVYRRTVQGSAPYDVPPPSYQMAMNCPTTPYPSGGMPPMPAPTTGYAGYPPKPTFPIQAGQVPVYNATSTAACWRDNEGDRYVLHVMSHTAHNFHFPPWPRFPLLPSLRSHPSLFELS
uniref:DAZ-associated protein 2 n=1 Tax=Angiostrongylus cantonensis TaxID=6313 RepID=A0A0K0DQ73_ANGCA